jgi:SAM-dependent methyltransferase
VADLGVLPLSNALVTPDKLSAPEMFYPLVISVCQRCFLVQTPLTETPERFFSDYPYFSSFSDALLRHAREAVERYIREFSLSSQSHVVEIASNDGYLLQNFTKAKIPCLGIEPAANIAKVAREKGIETVTEFFGNDLAKKLSASGKKADLILGNNVFAHAPNTNDFVSGLKTLLQPKGRIVLEFPYAIDLIEHTEFDTIYHEHVFYFTLTALQPLFARHGLEIFRVERLPIHGGSLRLFACHAGAHPIEDSARNLFAEEKRKGADSLRYYEGFANQVLEIKQALLDLLNNLRKDGKRVAAYGASAKGSTLLNFYGVGKDQLEFVVDRSTYKQGRLTPGTHIPILPAEALMEKRPDYTLLLTWNFAEEIMAQQKAYREKGKFIIPIPKVSVV